MKISVVIPSVNDLPELLETVKSVRETAPEVEIVVVDDCSAAPVSIPREFGVIVHQNTYRIGSGASRHVGAQIATGDYMLMTDSHCRFEAGWADACYNAGLSAEHWKKEVVFCGICHGFTPTIPPFGRPSGVYYGANLQFVGHDLNQASRVQVLEGVWSGLRPDNCEISCMMGACYLVPRKRFLELGGMQHFRVWGCEEQMMSLKFWLSGGEVRLLHGLKTWHRFRDGEKMPFRLETWNIIYNKLFIIYTIFPDDMAAHMISRFPKGFDFNKATETIRRDWGLVEAEKARNKTLFTRDVQWMLNKFQIPLL